MVGLQTLDLAIGVRVPASQPNQFRAATSGRSGRSFCFRLAWRSALAGPGSVPPEIPITAYEFFRLAYCRDYDRGRDWDVRDGGK
jgi:hypothetical protein